VVILIFFLLTVEISYNMVFGIIGLLIISIFGGGSIGVMIPEAV